MKYTIDGIIKFHPTVKLRLDTTVNFTSPSGVEVTLNATSDDSMAVQITLEANGCANAKESAQLILDRISNLLSYFHDVPISQSQLSGRIESETSTPEGKHIKAGTNYKDISARFALVIGLGLDTIEEVAHHFEQEFPQDFEAVIYMWREAISAETEALKYLLLYRLIEFLFGNDTKALTDWIKAKEPSVTIASDRQRGDVTIYTYLRDNIHWKQKEFPMQEIYNYLPRLKGLVKEKIKEKFPNHSGW